MPIHIRRNSTFSGKQESMNKYQALLLTTLYVFLSMPVFGQYPAGYNEALVLYRHGKYPESLEKLRSIFEENRQSLELRMLAAANYERMDDHNNALAHLQYCVKDHPEKLEPRLMMAGIFRKMKRYYSAIGAARKALVIHPDNIDLQMEIARSFYSARNYKAAGQVLEKILSTEADNFEAVYIDGLIYLRMSNLETAEFRLRQALQLVPEGNPVKADLLNNLGFAIERNGDVIRRKGKATEAQEFYVEARKYYEKALSIDAAHENAKINNQRVTGKVS